MKYRNIYKLVDAIKKEVPKGWGDYASIIHALDDVKDSADYRAPEAYVVNFDQLASVLQNWIGEPLYGWQRKIQKIFNGEKQVKGMTYIEF